MSVSVNKMRGVLSAQPQKVGDYQLDNIDHVFFGTTGGTIGGSDSDAG